MQRVGTLTIPPAAAAAWLPQAAPAPQVSSGRIGEHIYSHQLCGGAMCQNLKMLYSYPIFFFYFYRHYHLKLLDIQMITANTASVATSISFKVRKYNLFRRVPPHCNDKSMYSSFFM